MTRLTSRELADSLTRRGYGLPAALVAEKSKRPKYKNKKVVIDGKKFDSIMESKRYCVLKLMQADGLIHNLKCQVPYPLVVNGLLICKYVADFVYFDSEMSEVVEDVKGFKTKDYQIKKKLMKACHRIDIFETREKRRAKP